MNKKVLIILLLLFPIIISASCDENKHDVYRKISSSITYDNTYDKQASRFTVTIYNITNDMYIVVNNKKYTSNGNDEVVINDIRPGTNLGIYVYANDGCDAFKYISVREGYFNKFYNTSECAGYEKSIAVCSSEFTEFEITKAYLDGVKENYRKSFDGGDGSKKEEEPMSIPELFKELIKKWWVKVLLVVLTTSISISIFKVKFRKMKHGI